MPVNNNKLTLVQITSVPTRAGDDQTIKQLFFFPNINWNLYFKNFDLLWVIDYPN